MTEFELAVIRRLDAMDARQAEILALLRAGKARGPRPDAADATLLRAIATAIGDRAFTSAEILAHAKADGALDTALLGADITEPHDLGTLFRLIQDVACSGLKLEKLDEYNRAGAVWVVRVCEVEPRSLASADD